MYFGKRSFGSASGFLVAALLLTSLGLSSCFGESEIANPLAPRLSGKHCELWQDSAQIPHIRSEGQGDENLSELLALSCMGFVHARDRAFQMDFLRRTAEGKVAELLGQEKIALDFQMRLFGLSEKARSLFEAMNENQRNRLWAYAYGVNRALDTTHARDAYEFKQYGYAPAGWRPENSLEILLLESLDQTRDTFEQRINEAGWLQAYQGLAPKLYSRDGLPWETTILKAGEYPRTSTASGSDPGLSSGRLAPEVERLLPRLRDFFSPGLETFRGSNNWVIAPERSRTGHAWFANDPHLDLKNPSFWYWIHLSGGGYDTMGASVPGIPTIPSGVNRHLAWGLTNAYVDVSDLTLVPQEDLNGAPEQRPTIWFRTVGGLQLPFFLKTFQRTRQGWPVLPLDDLPAGKALVLRWTGFDLEPRDIDGLFEVMQASSVQGADMAFSHVGVPSWNFVFADDQGGIGHRVCGRLIRHERPLPFGIDEHRLAELKPFELLTTEEAPHVLQPARGYVVTANNRHWPADARFNEGRAWATSLRAHRIEELLTSTPRHDLESIRRMQCDYQAQDARYLRTDLLKRLQAEAEQQGGLAPRDQKAIELLVSWDLNTDLDCKACGIYERWVSRLEHNNGLTTEALYHAIAGEVELPQLGASVLKEFRAALDDLKIGDDGQVRTWGELHRNPFTHVTGDATFMNGSIGTPGAENTVSPGTYQFDEAQGLFVQTTGASQRLVVEMTSPPTVHHILPGTEVDVNRPDLAAEDGPWMKWRRCELERRAFPVDFSQVPVTPIEL